ncbi:MAG: HD domain-containing protein [Cellulosilyticaceae bacterium]
MIYRIKQFFWTITAKLSAEEKNFIQQYLFQEEQALFNKLKVYEQKHCITVAKGLEAYYANKENCRNEEKCEMIRVGLLHDIGKIKYPIGPVRKSIMVLLNHFTKGTAKRWHRLKMVKCYYNHPQIGYEMLKECHQYTEQFLMLVKEHQNSVENTSHEKDYMEKITVLQQYDNKA